MKIEKKYHFSAGHRNVHAGEKCGRIHGHTYNMKCVFQFDKMRNGVTMLFSDIDKVVEPIIKQYDHYFLLYENDPLTEVLNLANEPFVSLPFETSAENMAMWIFHQIDQELPIVQIELAETLSSTIIYTGEWKQ